MGYNARVENLNITNIILDDEKIVDKSSFLIECTYNIVKNGDPLFKDMTGLMEIKTFIIEPLK